MPVLDQDKVDERLAAMHDDLSKMIFTAARDWHRSFRIDSEDRDILCAAINHLIFCRKQSGP